MIKLQKKVFRDINKLITLLRLCVKKVYKLMFLMEKEHGTPCKYTSHDIRDVIETEKDSFYETKL